MAAWIVLEGGEGSGKSTQAALLASALDAVLTREPGGTVVGARLREVLLDPASGRIDERAEALLMAADRAEHVASVVMPALAAGRHVVSDRSAWSSLAYQGYGRGLDVDEHWQLSDWAMDGRWPDLALLIEVPPATAASRLDARGGVDRFEGEDPGFHARVMDGFRTLTRQWPERWVVVDGDGSVEVVSGRVRDAVRDRLGLTGP